MSERTVVGILVGVAGLLGVLFIYTGVVANGFDTALDQMDACIGEYIDFPCARKAAATLLDLRETGEVLDTLAGRVPPGQCHFVVHAVGQEVFHKYRDLEGALMQCNRRCDSACIHGVIGEAFAEELGFSDPDVTQDFDLAYLSPNDLERVGKRLCTNTATCHGVGHTLLQAYRELGLAFDACTEVADGPTQVNCYNGASMEYVDIITSQSMRTVDGVKPPDAGSLVSMCRFDDAEQMRACFRYFSRLVAFTMDDADVNDENVHAQTRAVCETYRDPDTRSACFAGLGAYKLFLVLTDPEAAALACRDLGEERDEAACIIGRIALATADRQKELMRFCSVLRTEKLQATCYQAVFHFLAQRGLAREYGERLCEDEAPLCLQGFDTNSLDPWEEIQKNFGTQPPEQAISERIQ